MKRRKKIVLSGSSYGCIEIPYRLRNISCNSKYLCICYYVTLPKKYRIIAMEYASFGEFAGQSYRHIIYSYLLVPVSGPLEAEAIMDSIESSLLISVEQHPLRQAPGHIG